MLRKLRTPPLRLYLFDSPAPKITFSKSAASEVRAKVMMPKGARGVLSYIDAAWCQGPPPSDVEYPQSFVWTTSQSRTLTAPCNHLREWHALAGWANQRIARIDYFATPGIGDRRVRIPR